MGSSAGSEAGSGNAAWLVGAAAGCVLLGALALSGGMILHLVGYVLASLLAFSLVALFRRRSLELSLSAGIGVPRWIKLTAAGILLAGFAIAVANAWFIASHLS